MGRDNTIQTSKSRTQLLLWYWHLQGALQAFQSLTDGAAGPDSNITNFFATALGKRLYFNSVHSYTYLHVHVLMICHKLQHPTCWARATPRRAEMRSQPASQPASQPPAAGFCTWSRQHSTAG